MVVRALPDWAEAHTRLAAYMTMRSTSDYMT
jgi:hypothetical protein